MRYLYVCSHIPLILTNQQGYCRIRKSTTPRSQCGKKVKRRQHHHGHQLLHLRVCSRSLTPNMITTRATTQISRRLLHTSSVQYGFMDWFSMKKDQQKKKEKAEDTSKVIERAEKGEVQVTKVEKIEFIGKKKDPADLRPISERLQGFSIKPWLSKSKVTTADEFKNIILSNYTKFTKKTTDDLSQVDLKNLNLRFDLTKAVQAESGYLIPDYVLTKANDGSVLQQYFEQKILTGDYLITNPEHLDIEDFEYSSPNISVKMNVTTKERKSKYKKLLKEAKAAQEAKAAELMKGVGA